MQLQKEKKKKKKPEIYLIMDIDDTLFVESA
jgi:predicted secreted acid phosphatase